MLDTIGQILDDAKAACNEALHTLSRDQSREERLRNQIAINEQTHSMARVADVPSMYALKGDAELVESQRRKQAQADQASRDMVWVYPLMDMLEFRKGVVVAVLRSIGETMLRRGVVRAPTQDEIRLRLNPPAPFKPSDHCGRLRFASRIHRQEIDLERLVCKG